MCGVRRSKVSKEFTEKKSGEQKSLGKKDAYCIVQTFSIKPERPIRN